MNLKDFKKKVWGEKVKAALKDEEYEVGDTCCVSPFDQSKALVRYNDPHSVGPLPKIGPIRWDVSSGSWVLIKDPKVEVKTEPEVEDDPKMVHLRPVPVGRSFMSDRGRLRVVTEEDIIIQRHGNGIGYVVGQDGHAELKRLGPDARLGVVCD